MVLSSAIVLWQMYKSNNFRYQNQVTFTKNTTAMKQLSTALPNPELFPRITGDGRWNNGREASDRPVWLAEPGLFHLAISRAPNALIHSTRANLAMLYVGCFWFVTSSVVNELQYSFVDGCSVTFITYLTCLNKNALSSIMDVPLRLFDAAFVELVWLIDDAARSAGSQKTGDVRNDGNGTATTQFISQLTSGRTLGMDFLESNPLLFWTKILLYP